MSEISDEMVETYRDAWAALPVPSTPAERVRAGLAAVEPLLRDAVLREAYVFIRAACDARYSRDSYLELLAVAATVLDAETALVVELDQEIDCCARAAGRRTRGGPDHCGLCGKPFADRSEA